MLRVRGGRPVTSRSPMKTLPELGSSSPAIIRIKVVLPQPDGPSSTRNSPSCAARSMPFTAGTSANAFVRARVSTVLIPWEPRPRRLDQASVLPFPPDLLAPRLGLADRVLRRQRTGRCLGEHRVEHPGREGLVDRRGRVPGIADIGRPAQHTPSTLYLSCGMALSSLAIRFSRSGTV